MSKWQHDYHKEFEKPKFVKSPIDLTVNIEKPPIEKLVEGKFGKRPMYIVEDKKLGAVYLSQKQFLVVAEAVGDLTKGYVTVTV
jgi:hypothetical protein